MKYDHSNYVNTCMYIWALHRQKETIGSIKKETENEKPVLLSTSARTQTRLPCRRVIIHSARFCCIQSRHDWKLLGGKTRNPDPAIYHYLSAPRTQPKELEALEGEPSQPLHITQASGFSMLPGDKGTLVSIISKG